MEVRHAHNWKEPVERTCIGCSSTFLTKKETKKYCTQGCWTSHNNKKNTEETKRKRVESCKKTVATPEHKLKIKNSSRIAEARKAMSTLLKQRILDGTFTPCFTNSWTRWSAFVDIEGIVYKFRSSWEAVFYLLNQDLSYESVRIPYVFEGKKSSYIVDFEDSKNKILYEIKPASLKNNPKNIAKLKAALKWCKENNYKYVDISNSWFKDNISRVDFNKHDYLRDKMRQFL